MSRRAKAKPSFFSIPSRDLILEALERDGTDGPVLEAAYNVVEYGAPLADVADALVAALEALTSTSTKGVAAPPAPDQNARSV